MAEEVNYLTVFSVDKFWSRIPALYLDAVSSSFSSPAELSEFCLFLKYSKVSIKLDSSIFTEETVDVNIYLIATTISSYAYSSVKEGGFKTAEHAWKMALSIEPNHLASWIGLATLCFNGGNYDKALSWSDKVLRVDSSVNNSYAKRMNNLLMSGKREYEAAEGMSMPGIVGSAAKVKEDMLYIYEKSRSFLDESE